ncbi:MAG TPA: hypothetical protein ENN08_06715 [Bacteroidales bacterium]|nr:hypothetical protein [Bacteroidales bacterium]
MAIIRVKRGLEANLPTSGLLAGEFLFATDTGNLYICKDATTKILLASGGSLSDYLLKSQNLNDVANKATARDNLDVYKKSDVDTAVDLRMLKSQNLNDVANKATARTNLEVYSKAEVDQIVSGLKWKQPVKAATTASITLSGTQTIDDVALAVNDRVLVKNQSDKTQNGIYDVKSDAWVRSADADESPELLNASLFVSEGTTQSDTAWVCTTDLINIGTTNIEFVQLAAQIHTLQDLQLIRMATPLI